MAPWSPPRVSPALVKMHEVQGPGSPSHWIPNAVARRPPPSDRRPTKASHVPLFQPLAKVPVPQRCDDCSPVVWTQSRSGFLGYNSLSMSCPASPAPAATWRPRSLGPWAPGCGRWPPHIHRHKLSSARSGVAGRRGCVGPLARRRQSFDVVIVLKDFGLSSKVCVA